MTGDQRVRKCAACQQNVYRFGNLDPFEVRELLIQNEGKPCVKFYDRGDGSVLVKDCPRGRVRRWNVRFVAVSAAAIFVFGSLGFIGISGGVNQAADRVVAVFDPPKPPPPHVWHDTDSKCGCMISFAQNNAY
jgi:hypothetical protein